MGADAPSRAKLSIRLRTKSEIQIPNAPPRGPLMAAQFEQSSEHALKLEDNIRDARGPVNTTSVARPRERPPRTVGAPRSDVCKGSWQNRSSPRSLPAPKAAAEVDDEAHVSQNRRVELVYGP